MSKIKLIAVDLDGTIISLKELHYEVLNEALASVGAEFVISLHEHHHFYDGMTTKEKLNHLVKTRNFPQERTSEVSLLKQILTVKALENFKETHVNTSVAKTFERLKKEGYTLYIVSNSVRKTIEIAAEKIGITHLVDKIISNEDVKKPKPAAEIYLKAMIEAGVSPHETLIVEDSKNGKEAALTSGGHVCDVDSVDDFTYDRIKCAIAHAEGRNRPVKWAGRHSTTVLIPMAGAGSRFATAGYKLPKPLIDVDGVPMIKSVVDNLNIDAEFVFIVQRTHYELYNLGVLLPLICPGCKIVQTDGLTEGAACTTLLAKELIDNNKHLLIANSDQFVEWDSCDFMYSMASVDADGGVLTFKDTNPKWSFAKLNEFGDVIEIAEKKPISDNATVGVYYWKKGSDYVRYAEQMIEKNIRVNNEFYVAPVYNEAIQDNKKIRIFSVDKMWGLGTPEDLTSFLNNYKK